MTRETRTQLAESQFLRELGHFPVLFVLSRPPVAAFSESKLLSSVIWQPGNVGRVWDAQI